MADESQKALGRVAASPRSTGSESLSAHAKVLFVTVAPFLAVCVIGYLLTVQTRQTRDRERVETAFTDIRRALSVGVNSTQLQEKVQALGAAVENYRLRSASRKDLKRYELALQIYADSLEYWRCEARMTAGQDFDDPDRVITTLKRIEKEMKDVGVSEVTSKEQKWQKADEVWRRGAPDSK